MSERRVKAWGLLVNGRLFIEPDTKRPAISTSNEKANRWAEQWGPAARVVPVTIIVEEK